MCGVMSRALFICGVSCPVPLYVVCHVPCPYVWFVMSSAPFCVVCNVPCPILRSMYCAVVWSAYGMACVMFGLVMPTVVMVLYVAIPCWEKCAPADILNEVQFHKLLLQS